MRKIFGSFATYVALLIGITGVTLVLYAWRLPPFASTVETTNDAYVRGQVTVISPQLAGYVAEVAVQDYQSVKTGQTLLRIDDRIYRQKLSQARATLDVQKAALANSAQQRRSAEAKIASGEAQVTSARSALATAQANWDRIVPLVQKGIVNKSEADATRSALDQATAVLQQAQAAVEVSRQDLQSIIVGRRSLEAAVEGAEAAVELATIDLGNTRIVAPKDGVLGEVGARLGQYLTAGSQITTLVPDRIWVTANFKETQLAGMRVGQVVTFTVDAFRGETMRGHIERFSPATGSEFAVLRADNATGNFTKVAQRLPVRIAIDEGQTLAERLAPGMSVVVAVDTAQPAPAEREADASEPDADAGRTVGAAAQPMN
ncbi:HlyD family secretion protein [Mangrovicella endophytica]|uniref:HlyD family secretion protein n=1 Tax=Mangrovicella endophytica TaxID=2066697 RepID=UPI000C9E34E2|nr:HlyD family secretion protein [Mangrovicella endophytica]